MLGITKRVFLSSRECLRQGWYLNNAGPVEPASDADKFRMEQGQLIGQQARLLHPEGVLVDQRRPSDAARRTATLLADPDAQIVFEAAFLWDGCTTRADLLVRGNHGWIVKEVKSALDGTGQTDELIDDVAYTAMVAQGSGLIIDGCRLLLLSRDYRLGMPPQGMFVETDVTGEVATRLPEFVAFLAKVKAALSRSKPPQACLAGACRSCEFFRTECIGRNLKHPILEIPRLHKNRLGQLADQGIVEIQSVPGGFPLSDTQRTTVACVKTGHEYVGPSLPGDLAKVEWPAAYLDFETVATAIPLYPGVAPYAQLTTQFSVHVCDKPGHVIAHDEFLADPSRDCRRELVENLLAALGDQGSVIVYHAAFERGQLAGSAELFPDLASRLNAVISRLFDLEVVIRRGYYHPAFRGSYSIKRVLPILVPELSYQGLPIGDGDTAVAKFARIALGHYGSEDAAEIRQQLLTYCHLDNRLRRWPLVVRGSRLLPTRDRLQCCPEQPLTRLLASSGTRRFHQSEGCTGLSAYGVCQMECHRCSA